MGDLAYVYDRSKGNCGGFQLMRAMLTDNYDPRLCASHNFL